MYHKPALNCRCSSHTYAPFLTTTVGKLLKESKLWHHEETLRNCNGKLQSCHCELELSCRQKWNPSQCKELTRFCRETSCACWLVDTMCFVNATLHSSLAISEIQNELVSFLLCSKLYSFICYTFPIVMVRNGESLTGSYCAMNSAPMFVPQLKYHTQLPPLPNIN
jgi:hypothetical protein